MGPNVTNPPAAHRRQISGKQCLNLGGKDAGTAHPGDELGTGGFVSRRTRKNRTPPRNDRTERNGEVRMGTNAFVVEQIQMARQI